MWEFLSNDFRCALPDFHDLATLPAGINSSFLALIPKIQNSMLISDFRPISPINTSMKIILKLLTNRIKGFLPVIIAEHQTAFIKGRAAANSILITSEVVHSIQKKHSKGLILKLDFEKVFDTVDWVFLLETLQHMGFGEKWDHRYKV